MGILREMDVEREKIGGVRGKRGQRKGPGEMTVRGDPVGGTKAREAVRFWGPPREPKSHRTGPLVTIISPGPFLCFASR